MKNTQDFSKFGQREREIACQLLSTYGTDNDKTLFLDGPVAVEFNPYSGFVFLVDADYNVGIMEGDKLVNYFSCPHCGHEETQTNFRDQAEGECCHEYADDLDL